MTRHRVQSARRTDGAYVAAVIFVALSFAPSAAHLLALPNKIQMTQDAYFTVQQIYRGWALLGFAVAGALLSTLNLVVRVRRVRCALGWAVTAVACIVGAQGLFWAFTYPANVATADWTEMPDSWEALRAQWEYSHAAAAVLDLGALVATLLSLQAWHRRGPDPAPPILPADGTDTMRWPHRVGRAAGRSAAYVRSQ